MVSFIGVGAQKAGTSWIYACLYEHPEICVPVKEIHFFSRPRFQKGPDWYEYHWRNCTAGKVTGEFSTSYLYSDETAKRIAELYPDTKIIAVLRNPVHRAYSQYRNSIKAGEIDDSVSFTDFAATEPSVIGQGQYAEQLSRYYQHFPKEQVLVLVYEDIAKDPQAFMSQIYRFLGVDDTFVPTMLNQRINVARTPRFVFVERIMHTIAETLRKIGLDKLVWLVRVSGLPDLVRSGNTVAGKQTETESIDREAAWQWFTDDVAKLSQMLDRDMVTEWKH